MSAHFVMPLLLACSTSCRAATVSSGSSRLPTSTDVLKVVLPSNVTSCLQQQQQQQWCGQEPKQISIHLAKVAAALEVSVGRDSALGR
jgi:hypothetical protein